GVEISGKHVEVIISQKRRKIRLIEAGATDVLPGSSIDLHPFKEVNNQELMEGNEPHIGEPVSLGITNASLHTDTVISAASFQETTRVLTDAAIKGKTDELRGLKENVIIGKLIPAGSGMQRYRKLEPELDIEEVLEETDEEAEFTQKFAKSRK